MNIISISIYIKMKNHEDVVNKNIDDILRKDYIKNMRVES